MPANLEQPAIPEPEQVSEEFQEAIRRVRTLLARMYEEENDSMAERGGFEPPVEL